MPISCISRRTSFRPIWKPFCRSSLRIFLWPRAGSLVWITSISFMMVSRSSTSLGSGFFGSVYTAQRGTFSSSHCLRTDSLCFFRIISRDFFSGSAKAILEKVALQRQLTNGLQHLGILLLQGSLLSLGFTLKLLWILENGLCVLQKLPLPVADHVGVQVVLGSDFAQLLLLTENLQDNLCLEGCCVCASWHVSSLLCIC